jgi:hypothetical protein
VGRERKRRGEGDRAGESGGGRGGETRRKRRRRERRRRERSRREWRRRERRRREWSRRRSHPFAKTRQLGSDETSKIKLLKNQVKIIKENI